MTETCYLYGIAHAGIFMIGTTRNPRRRLQEISYTRQADLDFVHLVSFPTEQEALAAERLAHAECQEYCVRWEWFRIKALDRLRRLFPQNVDISLLIMHEGANYEVISISTPCRELLRREQGRLQMARPDQDITITDVIFDYAKRAEAVDPETL